MKLLALKHKNSDVKREWKVDEGMERWTRSDIMTLKVSFRVHFYFLRNVHSWWPFPHIIVNSIIVLCISYNVKRLMNQTLVIFSFIGGSFFHCWYLMFSDYLLGSSRFTLVHQIAQTYTFSYIPIKGICAKLIIISGLRVLNHNQKAVWSYQETNTVVI